MNNRKKNKCSQIFKRNMIFQWSFFLFCGILFITTMWAYKCITQPHNSNFSTILKMNPVGAFITLCPLCKEKLLTASRFLRVEQFTHTTLLFIWDWFITIWRILRGIKINWATSFDCNSRCAWLGTSLFAFPSLNLNLFRFWFGRWPFYLNFLRFNCCFQWRWGLLIKVL